MQLSAPIYRLKRQAKVLARQTGTPLHQALDKLAHEEGFKSWSHLAASLSNDGPARLLLSKFQPGDLILLGARPENGKTLLGLELAARASELGRKGYFFTLDYHERDVAGRFSAIGGDAESAKDTVIVDTSDDISADYIISRLRTEREPALIVIDYLQLLDQKRANAGLDEQVEALGGYATDTGAICLIISQIDRSFDPGEKSMPDISDIRLPNPLELSRFSTFCFLHDGKIRVHGRAERNERKT